jgi:hypothetical protein
MKRKIFVVQGETVARKFLGRAYFAPSLLQRTVGGAEKILRI